MSKVRSPVVSMFLACLGPLLPLASILPAWWAMILKKPLTSNPPNDRLSACGRIDPMLTSPLSGLSIREGLLMVFCPLSLQRIGLWLMVVGLIRVYRVSVMM